MIFRLFFVVVYLIFFLIRIPNCRKQSQAKDPETYRANLSTAINYEGKLFITVRSFLSLMMMLGILGYVINPAWLSFLAFSLPVWLRFTAFVLAVIMLPLLGWAHCCLGCQYSPDLNLQEGHKIIMSGPYQFIRHPMYTILIIYMVCVSLLSANLLILIPHLTAIFLLLLRLDREETMLLEEFGNEYREYMFKTGRLLPKLY